jgi:hypothetical protein
MWVAALVALTLVVSACATPVGVNHVDVQTGYRLLTESVLSEKQPSEASKAALRRLGLMDRFDAEPEAVLRALLQQSVFFTPLPFVERGIFVAAPHRGAIMGGQRVGAIAAWLVTLPVSVFGGLAQAVASTGDEGLVAALRRPPTAIDNMNPRNPGLRIVESIPVSPRIQAPSIIAVNGDGPKGDGGDGVVAYQSAHSDGGASELVVRWDHSCQGQPEVIEEIRRILLVHAAVPGDRRS